MKFIFNNALNPDYPHPATHDITFDAFTATPGYELQTAIEDRRMSRVYRSVTKTSTEWIKFSTATALIQPDYVAVLNTNIISATSIKLQGNATDIWTAPTYDITIPQTSVNRYFSLDNLQNLKYSYILDVSATVTSSMQYWRILIDTPVANQPYFEIGNVYLTPFSGEIGILTMPGMNDTQSVPVQNNSIFSKSQTQQLYGDTRTRYREFSVTFPVVANSERANIDSWYEAVQTTSPFIMIPWEADITDEPPIYCHLTSPLSWGKNTGAGLTWNVSMNFREVF